MKPGDVLRKGLKVLGDALNRVAGHQSSEQARIQRQYTGLGSEFGQKLTEQAILLAITREPIAHRITFGVANDIYDKLFTLKPVGDQRVNEEKFNRRAVSELATLRFKDVFTQATAYERAFGWSIILIGYQDQASSLRAPVKNPNKITDLEAYAPTQVMDVDVEADKDSKRYGQPQLYRLDRGLGRQDMVHHTRVIHLVTRKKQPGYQGFSALEDIWDDLTVWRNMRWGLGQTWYRYGSGFPVITVEGADIDKLRELQGQWGPLTARTEFWKSEKQQIEFKGLEGRALDPEQYKEAILESISTGTSIPKPILKGAQAGRLAGSEVNEREYFKFISDQQGRIEYAVRELINALMETSQIRPKVAYEIEWVGAFELNPVDKARAGWFEQRAVAEKLNWMTVNEIRKEKGLERVEGGDVVPGIQKQTPGSFSQDNPGRHYTELQHKLTEQFSRPIERVLAEMMAEGDSVRTICNALDISKDTYYRWAQDFGLYP